MAEKQTIKEGCRPTPDKVAQELARIEEATIEEEGERRERGLTLEPEGKRLVRKQPREIKQVSGSRLDGLREERQSSLGAPKIKSADEYKRSTYEKRTIEDEAKDWLYDSQKYDGDYKFENIDLDTPVQYDESAPNLPPQFIDFLIGLAKIKTQKNYQFEDIQSIKIYAGGTQIGLGLRNSDGQLFRFYFRPVPPFEMFYNQ